MGRLPKENSPGGIHLFIGFGYTDWGSDSKCPVFGLFLAILFSYLIFFFLFSLLKASAEDWTYVLRYAN